MPSAVAKKIVRSRLKKNFTPPHRTLRTDVNGSMIDGAAFSLMVGLGENYLPAFILAIGLGEINSGLITTVPVLVGACFQLLSAYFVKELGSYRRWMVLGAAIQSVIFLPFAVGAYWGYFPAALAFLLTALYWGMGMSMGNVWNSWIATLIPGSLRTSFIAKRTRITQLTGLIGLLVGGLLLHSTSLDKKTAFCFIFLLASIARATSAYFLSQKTETPLPDGFSHTTLTYREIHRISSSDHRGGNLLFYLLIWQAAVQFAAPFFTPYLLSDLKLNYVDYVLVIASPFAAKILGLEWIGRAIKRYGPLVLLKWSALMVALSPLGWVVSKNFGWILFVQSANGFCWAIHELVTLLLVIQYFKEQERIRVLCAFNVANALLMTVSSILAASLLEGFGKTTTAYYSLFIISAVARVGTLVVLHQLVLRKRASVSNEDGFRKAA